MTVFKAYDVRAIYPDFLNEELAHSIGISAAKFLQSESNKRGPIVVGHDMRPSSPSLVAALIDGITSAGADVFNVGLVDTPFVAFAVNNLNAIGGIQTTASHNPVQYNGFKICRTKARPVGMGSGLETIESNAYKSLDKGPISQAGAVQEIDLWSEYKKHVFAYLDPKLQSGETVIKVAVDASNGMAGTMIPKLFSNVAGIDLIEINFENSQGVFAHEPNPLVESNLQETIESVMENKCDVGVCFDGDADRCMVVDEKGKIIGCDLITAWLASVFLKKEQEGASVVYDLRSSHAVVSAIELAGGSPVRSRVGHVFMKQAMADNDACFGGELSGHFYFRDNFYADSGAMAFASVLSALGCCGTTMSEQIEQYRTFSQSGEINFETPNKDEAMSRLVEFYPDATVDRLDGITIFTESWWCNVRASNTEPLLRLNLEAKTQQEVDCYVNEVSKLLGTRVDH